MCRKFNTSSNGYGWSESDKRTVWRNQGNSSNIGKDACGRTVHFNQHGNTSSYYGWEIDHILPVSRGGSDNVSNLQVLYWETNRSKSDQYPWSCR